MKKVFLLALSLFCMGSLVQAQQKSCCTMPATEEFADLAAQKDFIATHLNPIPYKHISEVGKDITFKAADGTEAYAYELKAAKPTSNYIFVIHEWWGLNDYVKKESEKIYNDLGNVNVIAIDLYDKKVATTREDAGKFMQAVTTERSQSIINGAFAYVGKKAKIGTIGWCFGGGWSLQTSILAGKQAKACVIYYGMPEKDVEKLKTLKAPVLGIFANKEKWISPQMVNEFEANMKTAKKKVTIKRFEADHAFANPSNPIYDEKAAGEAYASSIVFFKSKLK
jgi:carboxymethylenebutenolidase